MSLSAIAKAALAAAYATKGRHKGQLLARCPLSHTLPAAAWQGAMIVCNPYKVGIATMLFMTDEQRAVFEEVKEHFERLPRAYQIMAQRDREALERLGVW
jgi:predicted oxidoreductase (fatty acid repression mutant protein)